MSLESDVEMLLKKRPKHDTAEDFWYWDIYYEFESESGRESHRLPKFIWDGLSNWIGSFWGDNPKYGLKKRYKTYSQAMKGFKVALGIYINQEARKLVAKVMKS